VPDGPDSEKALSKPSKPTVLYANLHTNKTPFQILIDTGAAATCISEKALYCMTYFHYVDQTPSSFLLTDGVAPLKIRDLFSLSMKFAREMIYSYALILYLEWTS
jgi:hypothetical protein